MERRRLYIRCVASLTAGSIAVGCGPQWVTIGTPLFRLEDRSVQLEMKSISPEGRSYEVQVLVFNASNEPILERRATVAPGASVVTTLKTDAEDGRVVRAEFAMPFDRLAETRVRVYQRLAPDVPAPRFEMTRRAAAAAPEIFDAAVLGFVEELAPQAIEEEELDPQPPDHRGLPIQPNWLGCGLYLYPGLPGVRADFAVPVKCVGQE